jgi:hypothetical protein
MSSVVRFLRGRGAPNVNIFHQVNQILLPYVFVAEAHPLHDRSRYATVARMFHDPAYPFEPTISYVSIVFLFEAQGR